MPSNFHTFTVLASASARMRHHNSFDYCTKLFSYHSSYFHFNVPCSFWWQHICATLWYHSFLSLIQATWHCSFLNGSLTLGLQTVLLLHDLNLSCQPIYLKSISHPPYFLRPFPPSIPDYGTVLPCVHMIVWPLERYLMSYDTCCKHSFYWSSVVWFNMLALFFGKDDIYLGNSQPIVLRKFPISMVSFARGLLRVKSANPNMV